MTISATNIYDSHSDLQSHFMDALLDFFEVVHWASNRQIQMWLRGFATPRYTTLETALKKLSTGRKSKLRVATFYTRKQGTFNVYSLKRRTRNFNTDNKSLVYHGLAATECLIRFYRSDPGEIFPERFFNGMGSKPEWGIRYPSDVMLLLEFGTKSNVEFHNLISGKLAAYDRNLKKIEAKFSAKGIVLFVLDVPREVVMRRVMHEWKPKSQYRFTDFKTFAAVDIQRDNQFDAPIYINHDGTVGTL
jgi:hypothetical protein